MKSSRFEMGPEPEEGIMSRKIETGENRPSSHIILEFMRHGKKEKVSGKDDYDIRLTPEARVDAKNKGQRLGAQAEVAVAYGSPRKRAQEAAVRAMLGNRGEITDDMSVEEIEAKIAKYMKLGDSGKGKKLVVDERLDFIDETEEGLKAYLEGRYLEHMVRASDDLAVEKQDTKLTTYNRAAGNIAEIVLKWVGVGKNFSKVVERNPQKYKEFKNQLERYFGSHQGVTECFLLKAVEKVQGVKERDVILSLIPAGFNELQGFRIDIENKGEDVQVIHLIAEIGDKKINLKLTPEILIDMIEDRNMFDQRFNRT